jgi:hypothetical protein
MRDLPEETIDFGQAAINFGRVCGVPAFGGPY